jgi:hypothetical protein
MHLHFRTLLNYYLLLPRQLNFSACSRRTTPRRTYPRERSGRSSS